MKTELEQIEKMAPAKLFKAKAIGTLLKAIEIEACAEVPDVETPEGRKAITSLAYKVARSKTTIDDIGKKYVAEQKSAIAMIDGVRKVARDFLDILKVKVRQPLTEWEDAEQKRVERLTTAIDAIRTLGEITSPATGEYLSVKILEVNQGMLKAMKITRKYGEYQDDAINAKNEALVTLIDSIPAQEEREHEARENERRRQEEEDAQRVEKEQRIAREAVESADLESKRELQQIQDDKAQETRHLEARKRDTHLKGKMHSEAAAGIQKVLDINEVEAKKLVKAIVVGNIPNVTFNY